MISLQHKTLLLIVLLIPLVILVLSSTKKRSIPQSYQFSSTSKSNKSDSTSISEETKRQLRQKFVEVKKSDIIYQKSRSPGDYHAAPIVIEKYKLIFFTQRKVACTQWAALFRRMEGRHDWQNQEPGYRYKYHGLKFLYDYDTKYASHIMNSPLWTKAMFVRDPKERFVSAYFDKAVHTNYAQMECKNLIPPGRQFNTFGDFVDLTRVCDNTHWGLQSERMEAKFLPLLDFVGHIENVYEDAKALLKQIGAWEKFGKGGWGADGTENVFQSKSGVMHGADYNEMELLMELLQQEYAPFMEELDERFAPDYSTPQFHFHHLVSHPN